MIHILQSVSNMDRGGIESMLMNYYRHLDRTRFQFDFLVNKKKPGFFDDEIRALGGRIFQSPGVAPQSYPAYLRSMQQLLAQHPEIKVLHAHNEAMQLLRWKALKRQACRCASPTPTTPVCPRTPSCRSNGSANSSFPARPPITGPAGGRPASTTLDRARGMPGA